DLRLIALENFVDCDLSALFNRNYLVHGFESSHGDVNDVIPGTDHDLDRRYFVEHALIDRYLRAPGLSMDAHCAHSGGAFVRASKQLLELSNGTDFIGVTQRTQCRRELEILARTKIGSDGLIQVSLLLEQDCMAAFFDRE